MPRITFNSPQHGIIRNFTWNYTKLMNVTVIRVTLIVFQFIFQILVGHIAHERFLFKKSV